MYRVEEMAFYELKVGLSLEFSMTSFLSRVAALGSETEWAFVRRNGWTGLLRGKERYEGSRTLVSAGFFPQMR